MKIIEEEENKLIIELTGETHTLCNVLRKEIMKDEVVKAAAYDITHPVVGQPEFEIQGENPRQSLVDASEKVKNEALQFKDLIIENLED